MATIAKAIQKLSGGIRPRTGLHENRFDFSRFTAGDSVIVQWKKTRMCKRLVAGQRLEASEGYILHDNIIGTRPGQPLQSHNGSHLRALLPDLDQYIALTPRKVTPVYASYANHVVSMLDIHVPPASTSTSPSASVSASDSNSDEPSQSRIEILDAGTGHGSITLHLARAIAGANTLPPVSAYEIAYSAPEESNTSTDSELSPSLADSAADLAARPEALETWRASRRAVVHTVEISPIYSRHAQRRVVSGFRRGLYLPHIEFHVGNVHDWIGTQLEERAGQAFLDYAFLDLPGAHRYLGQVTRGMKSKGRLVVFVPSVTQIGDCVAEVRREGLPLVLEKVVEVGEGVSTGRLWDVRSAVLRKRNPMDKAEDSTERDTEGSESGGSEPGQENPDILPKKTLDDEAVMVCRPKVGERTMGGGFIGLWKRKSSDYFSKRPL